MWTYSHASHRVTVLGRERLEIPRGSLILVTHRRETDVPVVCPPLYRRARLWRHPTSFAARDDMFLPGFFAGFPPDLSPRARRALYRVNVARFLPRVEVHPIRSAQTARLGEVLAARGDEQLPETRRRRVPDARGRVRDRAAGDLPRGAPRRVRRSPLARGHARRPGRRRPRRVLVAPGRARRRRTSARSWTSCAAAWSSSSSPRGVLRRTARSAPCSAALARSCAERGRRRSSPSGSPTTRSCAAGRASRSRSRRSPRCPRTMSRARHSGSCASRCRSPPARSSPDLVERGSEQSAEDAAVEAVHAARAEGRFVEPDLLRARRRAARLADALAAARTRPDEVAFLAREFRSARA